MRKLIVIALASASLVACGSKTYYITETVPTTEVEDTTTTKAPRTTAPKPVYTTQPFSGSYLTVTEQNYVDGIHELFSGVVYLSDDELINAGYTTCSSLRAGMTGDQMMEVLINASGYDAEILELLSVVVASAIVWFCPDQAWKVG